MSNDKTALGNRCKNYERNERFMPMLPIIARLDGRSFSNFCKGLAKPFDEDFHNLMVETTRFLVDETSSIMGYTQSDEITLVWYSDDYKSQVFFDGRVQKMVSILSAMATLAFNRLLPDYIPSHAHKKPLFDCRAFQVPTLEEVANVFLWRERDATRNSILAVGQANFSHKQLQKKGTKEIQEMLFQEKGLNWNDCEPWQKRGTWIQKRRVLKPFSAAELDKLPAKHQARKNPELLIERWELRVLDMPSFGSVQNRAEVIFKGADPVVNYQLFSDGGPNRCVCCGTLNNAHHSAACVDATEASVAEASFHQSPCFGCGHAGHACEGEQLPCGDCTRMDPSAYADRWCADPGAPVQNPEKTQPPRRSMSEITLANALRNNEAIHNGTASTRHRFS